MLLYLTRHGKTDYNAKGLCQGQLDIPLNEEGRQAALELGKLCEDLPLTKIYSSELSRAYDTAQSIAQHHPKLSIEKAPALKNQFWGPVQGHPNLGDPPDDQFEIHEQLEIRLCGWLESIVQKHVRGPSPDAKPPALPANEAVILAVSHEDCIMAIRNILLAAELESADPHNLSFETEIAPGVNITGRPSNTTLAKIRLSRARTDKGEGSVIQVRIEAWGSADHVPQEQPEFVGLLDKWP